MNARKGRATASAAILALLTLSVAAAAPAGAATFTGPPGKPSISIPESQGPGGLGMGIGDPYPYEIKVFGLPGSITDLTARTGNMAHTHPTDIDLLLVGPRGQQAMLMSDTCGTSLILNQRFLFDQDAASGLPQNSCVTGRYQPTNRAGMGLSDPMPLAPAPTGGPGAYPADLSAFNGTDPNGLWRVFAYDDDVAGSNGGVGGVSGVDVSILIQAKCRGVTVTSVGANRRRDFFSGTSARDVMAGLGGGDVMAGLRGNDLTCGGKGTDRINGGGGRDVLVGGKGGDQLVGGKGRDLCLGGPGSDTARGCERMRGI
jgi:hypothetical protein